jgi:hypothetical protein
MVRTQHDFRKLGRTLKYWLERARRRPIGKWDVFNRLTISGVPGGCLLCMRLHDHLKDDWDDV